MPATSLPRRRDTPARNPRLPNLGPSALSTLHTGEQPDQGRSSQTLTSFWMRAMVMPAPWHREVGGLMNVADLLTGTIRLDRVVVSMSGEIDVFTAPYFRTMVDEALSTGADPFVVDLAGVTFMDARGLTVLVGARRRLDDSEGHLVVQAPRAPVRRLFEITNLTALLGVQGHSPPIPVGADAGGRRSRAADEWAAGLSSEAGRDGASRRRRADGASIPMPGKELSAVAASNDVLSWP